MRSSRGETRLDAEGTNERWNRGDIARTRSRHIPAPVGWNLEDSALHGLSRARTNMKKYERQRFLSLGASQPHRGLPPWLDPNRNGPPYLARHSLQIASMRATSAAAPSSSARALTGRATFIGRCRRSGIKPACISEAMARAWARAADSCGHRPAAGNFSARYSRIASDFPNPHLAVDEHRHPAGAAQSGNARLEIFRFKRDHGFLERDPCRFQGEPRPQRPRRVVLVADDQVQRHQSSVTWISRQRNPGDEIAARVQMSPVTTARNETNRTAAAVNNTVSAVSAHSLIAGGCFGCGLLPAIGGRGRHLGRHERSPSPKDNNGREYRAAAMKDR